MVSPIHGADGNVEFLLHIVAPTAPTGPGGGTGAATEQAAPVTGLDLDELVEQAIAS
jgi:hypothetical protein